MRALPSAIVVFGASGFVGRNIINALTGRVERLVGVTGGQTTVPGCTHVVPMARLTAVPALPDDTVVVHVAAHRYDAQRFDLAQSDIVLNNVELNTGIYHFCAERKISE